MEEKIHYGLNFYYLNIYINDVLHLSIKLDEWYGTQGYFDDKHYSIEVYMKNGTILLEYEDIRIWKEVLKIIDNTTK